MKKYALLLSLLLAAVSYKSFAADQQQFTLESSAFKLNSMIPAEFTCEGVDRSPPLAWHNAPAKTQSFALVVDDPNATNGTWTHWIIFNIPPTVTSLDAGAPLPEGAVSGKNSWGGLGYRGPCPPFGAHSYVFKVYALDRLLNLDSGTDSDTILQMMTGHVIGDAKLVGLFQKISSGQPNQ